MLNHKEHIPTFWKYAGVCLLLIGAVFLLGITRAHAGVIITSDTADGYAWNSYGGWVNFATDEGNVQVTDEQLVGYAWDSNYGWLNLSPTYGGVTNDGEGNLSGYAWSVGGGWISFDGITIDSDGVFHGQTSESDAYGILNFDCSYCSVVTDWGTNDGGSSGSIRSSSNSAPAPTPTIIPAPLTTTPYQPRGEVAIPATVRESIPEERNLIVDTDVENAPEELFDIRVIIDGREVYSVRDLVARTTFESFGRVPTPVTLSYSIVNASGEEVYSLTDDVVIETEGVLVTRFTEAPELPYGTYTFHLHTQYNIDVTDDFEISFTIIEKEMMDIPWWVIIVLAGLLVLFGVIYSGYRYMNQTGKVAVVKKKEEEDDTSNLYAMYKDQISR